MILITGAGGMLGQYLMKQFHNEKIASLGLRQDSDFKVDLTKETPHFKQSKFETVIHTAGTEDDKAAMELNLEGTKRLLSALEKDPHKILSISAVIKSTAAMPVKMLTKRHKHGRPQRLVNLRLLLNNSSRIGAKAVM